MKCICKGNLRLIVSEVEGLIGKKFKNEYDQKVYTFFGVIIGDDDYYYGMYRHNGTDRNSKMRLLSCVINLESHGYKLVED